MQNCDLHRNLSGKISSSFKKCREESDRQDLYDEENEAICYL